MKNFLRFRDEEGKLKNKLLFKLSFIFIGIASTIWFLIRVIPKPQRALYPCMRTAAPIMSSFVIYLVTLTGSMFFFRKAYAGIKKAKYLSAIAAIVICLTFVAIFSFNDAKTIYAEVFGVQWTRGVLPDAPNTPMGTAWGIFPGRVAWALNPASTRDACPNTINDAYFMAKNTNQLSINSMANKSIIAIGGKSTVKDSWDAIFKSFNLKKKGAETGYVTGEKIFIKINNGQAGWAIVASTLAETSQGGSGLGVGNAMTNTSPQVVLAFVTQLVDSCGVAQGDVIIGEPMTHVYKSMYDIIHPIYPNVILIDKDSVYTINKVKKPISDLGRTKSAGWTDKVIKYSDKGKVMTKAVSDNMMKEMYNAEYLINIAALKAHARGGVTFCAKNNFGSTTHGNTFSADPNHAGLISTQGNDAMTDRVRGDYHMYRVLTDLMGHEKLGLNTILFVVDGLWSGIEATDMPVKWKIAPFNNDWPSSLFISQDEIAVESVCLDFLRAEADKNTAFNNRPFFPAVDDFLHQGADSANWPDSISNLVKTGVKATWYKFAGYDPEGDGTLMPASLGVHEHWNNATDKQYSKNLSADGKGIELYSIVDTVSYIPTPTSIKNIESVSLSVYPNPCMSGCEISYQLKSNANVSLYVINMEGKIVQHVKNGNFAAGNYNDNVSVGNLKNGIYIGVLKINSATKTIKFEVKK